MRIPVAGLHEGVHESQFREKASTVGLGNEFSDIHVTAVIRKTADDLHLTASIDTRITCVCDRCLNEFTSELASGYEMHYVHQEEAGRRFDPAEVQVIAPGTPFVDIDEDVRQTLVVAVPLKLLCSASCKGLCPGCGKNLNDGPCDCRPEPLAPHWDALKELRTKK